MTLNLHEQQNHGGPPRRLLVVMPSSLGDVVMATPTLRALRSHYPQSRITALVKRDCRGVLDPCPWVDRVVSVRPGLRDGLFELSRRLAGGKFDAAVILPNSFRTALLTRMAGIERRIGYARDGRATLLTDRLLARRRVGGFVPVPTHEYYLGIARYLGAVDPDPTLELLTRPEDDAATEVILARAGGLTDHSRPLVLMVPADRHAPARAWPADRYAELADRCAAELGAVVALVGSAKEKKVIERVIGAAQRPIVNLSHVEADRGLLKSVIRRSAVLVGNDAGPRHVAAALGVPVVTLFGPTDPAWTDTGYDLERQVRIKVYCSPCQKRKCPLRQTADEHQCLRQISAATVYEQVASLVGRAAASPRAM